MPCPHFCRYARPGTRMKQNIIKQEQSFRCELSDNASVPTDGARSLIAINSKQQFLQKQNMEN